VFSFFLFSSFLSSFFPPVQKRNSLFAPTTAREWRRHPLKQMPSVRWLWMVSQTRSKSTTNLHPGFQSTYVSCFSLSLPFHYILSSYRKIIFCHSFFFFFFFFFSFVHAGFRHR
jgi:hypothetical protein